MKSVRQSNFELLRIVCMLMIITGHILNYQHTDFDLDNPDYIIPKFFKGFLFVAVNSFVLISGYWGIQFKVQKLLKLEFQILFYSIMVFLVMTLLGFHQIDFKHDFFYFLPVITKRYWFVTCYISLFLISPFLNHIKDHLSKSDYKMFLLGGFVIIYLWPTFTFLIDAPNLIEDGGYGIVNFIYLYFLGHYIHQYYRCNHSWKFYILLYLIISSLLGVFQYIISLLLGFDFTSLFCYNTIFIFGASVSFFIAFSKMSFQSRWINYLAKSCFSVFLIHAHLLLWGNYCSYIGVNDYRGFSFLLLLAWQPITIYLVCSIIENLRLFIFGKMENILIEKTIKNNYHFKEILKKRI